MLLLQKPKSFNNLVQVTNEQNLILQDNGFSPVYKWQVKIPFSEIARRLNARGVRNVTVTERSPSKRVKTLTIATASGVKKIRADKFRTALGAIKVKSTFFGVARKGDAVILTGRGFGHGGLLYPSGIA